MTTIPATLIPAAIGDDRCAVIDGRRSGYRYARTCNGFAVCRSPRGASIYLHPLGYVAMVDIDAERWCYSHGPLTTAERRDMASAAWDEAEDGLVGGASTAAIVDGAGPRPGYYRRKVDYSTPVWGETLETSPADQVRAWIAAGQE